MAMVRGTGTRSILRVRPESTKEHTRYGVVLRILAGMPNFWAELEMAPDTALRIDELLTPRYVIETATTSILALVTASVAARPGARISQ
jgi:hypothetical protein